MISQENKFYQKKSLSQVFLREEWPCQRMAKLLVDAGIKSVIEIGPGKAVLTKHLAKEGLRVTAVKKDSRLIEFLQDYFRNSKYQESVTIVNSDILEFDFQGWLKTNPGPHAVCGNIPYNISTPILIWILENKIMEIDMALFLVQLEFAQRVVAPPNNKTYGSLSVFAQLRSQVGLEFTVAKANFSPVPKVDSAVLSLKKPREITADELLKKVEIITRKAFSQRRKQLVNSLDSLMTKKDSLKEFDLTRRCETLSPSEFVRLAQLIA